MLYSFVFFRFTDFAILNCFDIEINFVSDMKIWNKSRFRIYHSSLKSNSNLMRTKKFGSCVFVFFCCVDSRIITGGCYIGKLPLSIHLTKDRSPCPS